MSKTEIKPRELERLVRLEGKSHKWLPSLASFLYIFGTRISEALARVREDFKMQDGNLVVKIDPILKRKDKASHELRANIEKTPFISHLLRRIQGTPRDQRLWTISRQQAWAVLHEHGYKTHTFRHTRINRLIEHQPTVWELQDFMGWKDPRTSMNYLALHGQLARRFSDKLD